MQTLLIILIILASILLSFLILIQNPKGGGLASGFAGGTNLMGVKRTGDILEKGTWGLIISIIVFSLIMNVSGPSSGSGGNELMDQINPSAPTSTPLPATEVPEAILETDTDTTQ
ncbi:preprotein translocase subunit SecG [Parapedobacter tibetensis]|uniref:preprotein translocase subunit SecG n=1 Tax=Parapedobacter tibetensis TaxID=2972951 RepID=UPI00214D3603|nr:preprotein translocase subunit SecG [Parapedobacter tibetensis]